MAFPLRGPRIPTRYGYRAELGKGRELRYFIFYRAGLFDFPTEGDAIRFYGLSVKRTRIVRVYIVPTETSDSMKFGVITTEDGKPDISHLFR